MSSQEFKNMSVNALKEHIAPRIDDLVDRPPAEYGDYRDRAGYIRGIRDAIKIVEGVFREMHDINKEF